MSNTFTLLQQALQPTVRTLVQNLGITVTVRPRSLTIGTDGDETESWTVDPTGVGLHAMVELLSVTAAQRLYGTTSQATARLMIAGVPGALPAVNVRDAVRITTGPLAGTVWLAEAEGAPDAIGASITVPLRVAPAGVVIP